MPMMQSDNTDFDFDDIETAEQSWPAKVPNVEIDELPETTMAVKAHNLLADKIQLADQIAIRAVELGMTGMVTVENYSKAKTIVGLCRSARGDIKRNKEAANRDAIDWQKAIVKRAKELTSAIDSLEAPYKAGIEAIDEAKEAEKQAKIDAERKAIEDAALAVARAEQAAADAKRAQETEANRIEAERLATEREALATERLAAEAASRAAREKLTAELDEKLATERAAAKVLANAEAAERAKQKKIDDDLREFDRIEAKKLADELAEFKRVKAAADAETQRQAEAEAARIKAEETAKTAEAKRMAMMPDIEKVGFFGVGVRRVLAFAPTVDSDEAKAIINRATADLERLASDLTEFGTK